MAKILISPLGVGGRFKDKTAADREYQEADYQIDGKSYKNRFMASALYDHLELDEIIFIGTVRSMWEEVYRFFCEKNKQNLNQEYWLELAEKIDSMNHETNLDDLNLSPVKDVLGERSDCILIKYGLNNEELWENLDLISQVVKLLKSGDEVYIDITHSFRSLSLFLFLVLTFIKDLPENENIRIAGVYYGMLDISREMGYTPVIDLKSLFDMTDWIKGSYILNHYGDGNLIAQLLQEQGESTVSDQIRQLSSAININYLPAIRDRARPLNRSLTNISIPGPFKYIKETLTRFVRKFSNTSDTESEFQLKLAGWYFENDRYAAGYITLTESIITYLCEIHNQDVNTKDDREQMKKNLFSQYRSSELKREYDTVNSIRKQIAHASLEENRESYSNAINQAKNHHNKISNIFRTGIIR
ncbi:TIGR02221 family CRISPR-associated protein [Spirulina subsalsa]|uniref:TIGR02221 family CRISPR-associated protein n=1 Tax=Spirulina subsalsa TaxID=54311 RepID=UPI00031C3C5C|nr:TIGR02221 family CRISPR-associated protein [Spirulina subsalsa]